jgi:RNA polymerase sigma-70 factor (ECF subfamily)
VHQRELPIPDLRDPDPELGALVRRAREGSLAAFEQLASHIHDQVRRWAARLTRDDDEADDVAQVVLLQLHLRLREFEGRSRFSTWLYRITRNVALNRRRTAVRRRQLLEEQPPEPVHTDHAFDHEDETRRIAELVRFYLRELRGRQREAFELVDIHGQSPAEVAERLGVKPVTVRAWVTRARQRIRLRMLEAHPELLEDYEP